MLSPGNSLYTVFARHTRRTCTVYVDICVDLRTVILSLQLRAVIKAPTSAEQWVQLRAEK